MEPIISPWTIYFIEHILFVVSFIKGILFVAVILEAIAFIGESSDEHLREEAKENTKVIKTYLICTTVILLILSMVPSREVAYKMFISSYITPDNLNLGKEITKDGIEWLLNAIVESINKIK
jgi:hypothetical protein